MMVVDRQLLLIHYLHVASSKTTLIWKNNIVEENGLHANKIQSQQVLTSNHTSVIVPCKFNIKLRPVRNIHICYTIDVETGLGILSFYFSFSPIFPKVALSIKPKFNYYRAHS